MEFFIIIYIINDNLFYFFKSVDQLNFLFFKKDF